jgi:hypothetical protein
MPYTLQKSGDGYKVFGPGGPKSKKPLPRSNAVKQLRALYAAMPQEERPLKRAR